MTDQIKLYTKKQSQPMEPWTADIDMTGVSVGQSDIDNGSPKQGDMIAHNPDMKGDRWLVAEQFFNDNYVEL